MSRKPNQFVQEILFQSQPLMLIVTKKTSHKIVSVAFKKLRKSVILTVQTNNLTDLTDWILYGFLHNINKRIEAITP